MTKYTFALTCAICINPIIIGYKLWNKLPEKMPVHFKAALTEEANKVMVVLVPGTLFLIMHVFSATFNNDAWLVMPILSIVYSIIVYGLALGKDIPVVPWIFGGLAVSLISLL